MRQRERGEAPVFLLVAVVLAASVGVAVYVKLKERRLDTESALAAAPHTTVAPSAAVPEPAPAPIDPPPEPVPPSTVCDEVNCVLANYEGDCCAQYRPAARPADDGVPEAPSAEEIETVVEAARAASNACAAAEAFEGQVRVTLKIRPSGRVETASVEGAPSDAVSSCVVRAYRRLKFGKSRDGTTVRLAVRMRGNE